MIQEITIENLAILDQAQLELHSGFTAITGETGAGKSVLLTGAKIILGERTRLDWIRHGQDKLRVEMIADINACTALQKLLEELELGSSEGESSELILERVIFRKGKNRCRINGSVVNLNTLGRVSKLLIDLHGQHQQQSLLEPETHLNYLDSYGKLESLLDGYRPVYKEWKSTLSQLAQSKKEQQLLEAQRDFVSFQLKELDKAQLKEGEEDELEEKINLLSSVERIDDQLKIAEGLLDSPHGLITQVSELQKAWRELGKHSQELGEEEEHLENILIQFKEQLRQVQSFDRGQSDPRLIDSLNGRMAALQRLKAKYQKSHIELIQLRESYRADLDKVENFSYYQEELQDKIKTLFDELVEKGKKISVRRKTIGKQFEKAINTQLSFLGMGDSLFTCQWGEAKPEANQSNSLHAQGLDELEFLFQGNPGNPLKPLREVISGGEASRIMLAIKTVLAEVDQTPVLIFDEVDTGIGGHTANRVGEALKKLSEHHQVISITHLHQVAVQADSQLSVSKKVIQGKTEVSVVALSEEERVVELARMMGDDASQDTQKHAQELLSRAKSKKRGVA